MTQSNSRLIRCLWAKLPVAGRTAVIALPVVVAIIIGFIVNTDSRDRASYEYGRVSISGIARMLIRADAQTDAELDPVQTPMTPRSACEIATKGLPLVSGVDPEYAEKDVIDGCVDVLSETTAYAETLPSSARPPANSASTATASPTSPQKGNNGPSGHYTTIADYIRRNGITETPIVQSGALPDAPILNLPSPPGWRDSGETPSAAYGQIVSTDPAFASDPPTITAIFSRLTGDVDADAILRYAPNELANLPGYQSGKNRADDSLAGYPAVGLSGNYIEHGVRRIVAQKTVVITGSDGIYVLQLNLEGASNDAQASAATEAFRVINDRTTITP